MRGCWIGVAGGFVQLDRGEKASLQRLKAADMLAMHSPRELHRGHIAGAMNAEL